MTSVGVDVTRLLDGRPLTARTDRVIAAYAAGASVLYLAAYAADVAFAVDFWHGGGYSRLPAGEQGSDVRPLWLKVVVALGFPLVLPLMLNAMVALDVEVGASWMLRLTRPQRLLLAAASGPFLPVVATALTYYLDWDLKRAAPRTSEANGTVYGSGVSTDDPPRRFGTTEESDQRLLRELGGVGTLACASRRLRHCRVEHDVGGVGVELALREPEVADRFFFFFQTWQILMSIAAHLCLLLAGYRPGSSFAAFAPVLAMARPIATLFTLWNSAGDTASGGAWVASFFGVLLIAALLTEPTVHVGGDAPLFFATNDDDDGVRVSVLCAVWCWKIALLGLPEAAVFAVAATHRSAHVIRERAGDCGMYVFVVLGCIVSPATVGITVIIQEFNQLSWLFVAVLQQRVLTAFSVMWARFLMEAPTAEERARRLMHLLRCRMTAGIYDAVHQENAPWRYSAMAFADDRMDEVLLNAVVLNRGSYDIKTWESASIRPEVQYLPLLREMTCDARVAAALRPHEEPFTSVRHADRHASPAPDAASMEWEDPLVFWQRRSLIRELVDDSHAPFPQPATKRASLQGGLGDVAGILLYSLWCIHHGLLVLRALFFAGFLVFAGSRLFAAPNEFLLLHHAAFLIAVAGVGVAAVALPSAWTFNGYANTRMPGVRWSRSTVGDLTLWISVYRSPAVDELVAGALTVAGQATSALPFDVVQDVAEFLTPMDIRQHALPHASQSLYRDAALSAGYQPVAPLPSPAARCMDRVVNHGDDATAEEYMAASMFFAFSGCVTDVLRKSFRFVVGDFVATRRINEWNGALRRRLDRGFGSGTTDTSSFSMDGSAGVRPDTPYPDPVLLAADQAPDSLMFAGFHADPSPPTGVLHMTGGAGPIGRFQGSLMDVATRRLREATGDIGAAHAFRDLWEWQVAAYLEFTAVQAGDQPSACPTFGCGVPE